MSEDLEQSLVIVTDADGEDKEDTSSDNSGFNLGTATITISEDPQSVYQFVRKANKNNLILDPDFQRNLVWKPAQKSRFIESILLNFPVPPLYVNEQLDGKWAIIDGLQRTKTLIEFLNDEFSLVELKALPNLNGKFFRDLGDLQARIEDKKLPIYILKASTPMGVIYELFDRINTGGTPLNRQEVRHCIFRGKSTELLKELAQHEHFQKAIDYGVSGVRMKDREIVLRYLAFKILDKNDYQGDLSAFLEEAMTQINKMTESDLNAIRADFQRVMQWSYQLFGKQNFRLKLSGKRGTINTSIMESVCIFLSSKSDEYLKNNQKNITKNYNSKLLINTNYTDAVRFSTGSKSRVLARFKLAEQILSDFD